MAPPAPIVILVNNTQVQLSLSETTDDGGSPIIKYLLYVNEGSDGSPYTQVTSYDGSSLTITINVGANFSNNIITSGLIYTFYYVAENAIGMSDNSNLL